MKIKYLLIFLCFLLWSCEEQQSSESNDSEETQDLLSDEERDNLDLTTPFELDNNHSASYEETINYYETLAAQFPNQVALDEYGITDSGKPLHVAVISTHGDFEAERNRALNRRIIFINNAIHPGEPVGVDATMLFLRDALTHEDLQAELENVVLVVIPYYNIGGGLNRGAYSRANQVGPKEYGFRGNSQHLDLNRDFIKCDSKNAETFNQLFSEWRPDIFIDNHTTNGADYPYVMTLIPTQHNKLNPILAEYLEKDLMPHLYKGMAESGYEASPYVYARTTPDEGIGDFLDLPRYSSGYAALFNTISFIPEAHMLKPFDQRVKADYAFMVEMLRKVATDYEKIGELHAKADELVMTQDSFDINWTLDEEKVDSLLFNYYAPKYKPSEITGQERLYYDNTDTLQKKIPFYHTYKTTQRIAKPKAYIIPQAHDEVIERLDWNDVKMTRLGVDTVMTVEAYYIETMETPTNPFEGHYLHSNVKVRKDTQQLQFYQGDVMVFTNQENNRYIIETLEPQAPDSYFCWNFFDAILQQKEYFSPYVFEELALEILKKDSILQQELKAKKASDKEFAKDGYKQLDFIYKRSPHYEKGHKRYPIFRAMKGS